MNINSKNGDWLTTKEAAIYLSVSVRTILRAVNEGRLRHAKMGRKYLYKPIWLDAAAMGFPVRMNERHLRQISALYDDSFS